MTETDLQTNDTELDPAIAAIPESERPPEGSLEEAAFKIDRILSEKTSDEDLDEDLRYHGEPSANPDAEDAEQDEATDGALDDDKVVTVELEDGEAEVTIGDLKQVFQRGREFAGEDENVRAYSDQAQHFFQSAEESLGRLIPALTRQLHSEFADIQSPQDLQLLAATDPIRFAALQARQFALGQANAHAQALEEQNYTAFLQREAAELASLVPELTEEGTGDRLREDLRAYARNLGFDDDRLRQAGAQEIALLHKAMKYDRLQSGQEDLKKRVRRAKPVMRPGTDRPSSNRAGLKQAMAKLKKTGHVDDAARVIEMML
jgi:hypothetical protein